MLSYFYGFKDLQTLMSARFPQNDLDSSLSLPLTDSCSLHIHFLCEYMTNNLQHVVVLARPIVNLCYLTSIVDKRVGRK